MPASNQNLFDSMNPAALLPKTAAQQPVMPDDHSKSVPPLPIPNRTVKRLRANDSADSRVKVGHRQAVMMVLFCGSLSA